MSRFTIREYLQTDLESIRSLQPEGWEDITFYFEFYDKHPFCFPIVAEMDRTIIGVASGIVNGVTAWLAHIIVARDFRRRGIGHELTRNVMDILSREGCRTQILIATAEGEGLYAKLGFEVTATYKFYRGKQLQQAYDERSIRPIERSDYELLFNFDEEVYGEKRRHVTEHFMSNGYLYSGGDGFNSMGCFLPDFGEGLIIANTMEAGIELMKLKHGLKICRAVLPGVNRTGREFLEANGFEQYNEAPRMVFGRETNWKPHMIYSRIGGFYG